VVGVSSAKRTQYASIIKTLADVVNILYEETRAVS
jgi:hypothetical protein